MSTEKFLMLFESVGSLRITECDAQCRILELVQKALNDTTFLDRFSPEEICQIWEILGSYPYLVTVPDLLFNPFEEPESLQSK